MDLPAPHDEDGPAIGDGDEGAGGGAAADGRGEDFGLGPGSVNFGGGGVIEVACWKGPAREGVDVVAIGG